MESLTVEQLKELCKEQIKNGNAKKKILISSDDEGNSFHELFYPFATDVKEYKDCIYCVEYTDLKNYIILG